MSERHPLALTACLVASMALVLASCTADKPKGDPKPSAAPATQISTTPLPQEATFKGKWDGAVSDLTQVSCGLDAGEQVYKGTLKNSSSAARDYQIIIMWMIKDDGKPYGSGLVTLKGVKPGEEKPVEIKTKVATKVDRCLPNVKAGTLT